MKMLRSSMWAGLSVVVRAISSIAVNKIFAKFFLPHDFALLAHFQNLLTIFLIAPTDGANRGLIKYISSKEESDTFKSKIIKSSLYLNALFFVLSAILLVIFNTYFTSLFAGKISSWIWIGVVILLLFILLLNFIFQAILLAKDELIKYVLLVASSSIITIFLVYLTSVYDSKSWAFIVIGFGSVSVSGISGYFALKKINLREVISAKVSKGDLNKLSQFVLMALSVLVFGKIVEFSVRHYSLTTFGAYDTGLWQSAIKFSEYYVMAFTSILSLAYYPKITSMVGNRIGLSSYVKEWLGISIPVLLIAFIVIYLLRDFIIGFFFDQSFKPATQFMLFLLLGDFLKMLSFFFGNLVTAEAKTRLFVLLQAGSAIFYILLIYILTPIIGVQGFLVAHFIRFVAYFSVLFFYYKNLIFNNKGS
ncbi:MAG: hypothetical protein ACK40G_07955 [Cytophagaceae bacterium]